MIPKIIHYCWFGRGEMPPLSLKCIDSWKKFLPDYELKRWNEETFDVNSIPYVKEAYQSRKFAFVTDYVRLNAIYHEGGIYMDTDVEVLKSMDNLLHLPAFSGFESEKDIPTGIMASEKGGKWAKEMLEYYNSDRHFILQDGTLDMTSNVTIISKLMSNKGFKLKNSYQVYENCMHIFPKDYFCPKSRTGIITLTENSYCIHHFAASWHSKSELIRRYFFREILGPNITDLLVRSKWKLLGFFGIKRN